MSLMGEACLSILAPYSVYIIPKLDDNEKTNKSTEVYQLLLEKGVPVLYDDRTELSNRRKD